jgi:hypothetical protein
MSKLSRTAIRILIYLGTENPDALAYTEPAIGKRFKLTRNEWQDLLNDELKDMVEPYGDWDYRLTEYGYDIVDLETQRRAQIAQHIFIGGDVGPGASVGSGSVTTGAIAGQNVIAGPAEQGGS